MAPSLPRAGQSPLWLAAEKGRTAMAEALLAAGANGDLQDDYGAGARAVELGVAMGGMRMPRTMMLVRRELLYLGGSSQCADRILYRQSVQAAGKQWGGGGGQWCGTRGV
eukprot:7636186-Pyramimonas_sp.AAC.1